MIDLNRILLPTDFSECSAHAARYACALAERFDAELHVLHVLHDLTSSVPDFGMGLAFPAYTEGQPARREAREEAAIAELAKFIDDDWQQGRKVTLATKEGPAFLEIIRYAREHVSDLIVIGTHGRSGLSHALLGSVAERVVRKAPCPVLTVRESGHEFVHP